jgi:hypothetical protein
MEEDDDFLAKFIFNDEALHFTYVGKVNNIMYESGEQNLLNFNLILLR